MRLSRLYLAHLERESGNLDGGDRGAAAGARPRPRRTPTASLLGAYLTQAGRPAEAVAVLEPLAASAARRRGALGPALALARLGRAEEALATLARAREVDPSNAMVAWTSARFGSWRASARRRGRPSSRRSRRTRPARAHSSLAMMAAESGACRGPSSAGGGARGRPRGVREAPRAGRAPPAPGAHGRGAALPRALRRGRPPPASRASWSSSGAGSRRGRSLRGRRGGGGARRGAGARMTPVSGRLLVFLLLAARQRSRARRSSPPLSSGSSPGPRRAFRRARPRSPRATTAPRSAKPGSSWARSRPPTAASTRAATPSAGDGLGGGRAARHPVPGDGAAAAGRLGRRRHDHDPPRDPKRAGHGDPPAPRPGADARGSGKRGGAGARGRAGARARRPRGALRTGRRLPAHEEVRRGGAAASGSWRASGPSPRPTSSSGARTGTSPTTSAPGPRSARPSPWTRGSGAPTTTWG